MFKDSRDHSVVDQMGEPMKDISKLVFWLASMMAALMGFVCIRVIFSGASITELVIFTWAFFVPAAVALFAYRFAWKHS
jgi:hypothetical protein